MGQRRNILRLVVRFAALRLRMLFSRRGRGLFPVVQRQSFNDETQNVASLPPF